MPADIASPADAVGTVLQQFKQELESLPHTKRLSDSDTEAVYALAYREYGQAQYEQALRYFQLLLVYRPTHKVYLLGAALCLQRMRRYELAIAAFCALRFLDPNEPSHSLAAAECHLLCHDRAKARESLELVIDFCRENKGHDAVHARARAILELMNPRHEPVAT